MIKKNKINDLMILDIPEYDQEYLDFAQGMLSYLAEDWIPVHSCTLNTCTV